MESLCEYDLFGYHSRETVLGRKKVPYQLGKAESATEVCYQQVRFRGTTENFNSTMYLPLGVTSSIRAGKRGRTAWNLTYRLLGVLQSAIIAKKY